MGLLSRIGVTIIKQDRRYSDPKAHNGEKIENSSKTSSKNWSKNFIKKLLQSIGQKIEKKVKKDSLKNLSRNLYTIGTKVTQKRKNSKKA